MRLGESIPMTYCAGILVRDGLVLIADTRTNAGLDNIATFRKLTVVNQPGDRAIAIATAGNLAVSQAVMTLITEGLDNPETGEMETIRSVTSMFKAAQFVGRAIRTVRDVDGPSLAQDGGFEISFLLGGQLRGGRLRLFMIYAAGNFVEATVDTPYLQIGEHKYGKPILDRSITADTDLYDALKLGLISIDSTMRSNLSVGLPIDIAIIRRDALQVELSYRIERDDAYFNDLSHRWSEALRAAHLALPRPPYGTQ
jgi:putative proteasome-type protease